MYGSNERIPQLDGIRGVAILLVLCWHFFAGASFQPGNAFLQSLKNMLSFTWSGVDLFFVLSGFLIGGILMEHKESRNYFKVFYIRRMCRIFPMYFILLFGFLLLKSVIDNYNNPGSSWLVGGSFSLWPYITFLQNFYMAIGEYFRPYPLAVTWSLAVEEQFYLILPFLLWALPIKKIPFVCLFLILSAPVIRTLIMIQPFSINKSAAFILLPSRMDSLLIGVIGAWMMRNEDCRNILRNNVDSITLAFMVLFTGTLLFSIGNFGHLSLEMTPMGYTWLAILYLFLIFIGILSEKAWIESVLTAMPLRWLGRRSFTIYLFHLMFLGIFHCLMSKSAPPLEGDHGLLSSVSALISTILFASVSWNVIEKPFIRFGRRFRYAQADEETDYKRQIQGFV